MCSVVAWNLYELTNVVYPKYKNLQDPVSHMSHKYLGVRQKKIFLKVFLAHSVLMYCYTYYICGTNIENLCLFQIQYPKPWL